MRAFGPLAVTVIARRILGAVDRDLDRAAARDRRSGEQEQVEEELDLVLRQEQARRFPDKLGLLVVEIGASDRLRGRKIDAGPGRAGGSEGKARKLQPGRGACRAFAHELERVGAHRLVLFDVHHLEPIDDGADRADDVMAHAAAKQGGKVERFELDVGHLTVNNLANPVQSPLAKRRIGLDSPSESGGC